MFSSPRSPPAQCGSSPPPNISHVSVAGCPLALVLRALCAVLVFVSSSLLAATMNQKSFRRKVSQSVSRVLTANNEHGSTGNAYFYIDLLRDHKIHLRNISFAVCLSGGTAIFVMLHNAGSLTTAFCAHQYFILKSTRANGWLNKFELKLSTTGVTMHRGWRLDQNTHLIAISLCRTKFRTLTAYSPVCVNVIKKRFFLT